MILHSSELNLWYPVQTSARLLVYFIGFLQSTCTALSSCMLWVKTGKLHLQRFLMHEALECERALYETSCIFVLMWPELISASYKFLMSEAICSQEMFITHIWWLKWVPWATICGFEKLLNIPTSHPLPLWLTSRGLWRRAGTGRSSDSKCILRTRT